MYAVTRMYTGDSLTTITVCEDKAGVEETSRRAAAWVRENLPGTTIGAPSVSSGEVFVSFLAPAIAQG